MMPLELVVWKRASDKELNITREAIASASSARALRLRVVISM
ncbi:MAG: hypothetical protein QNJ32_29040 [Xenococcaceae cyanobacterium MO_167.B27]|nr:hypothetical protein [Xenococcaceae cyanobacterium MO_167.B27]